MPVALPLALGRDAVLPSFAVDRAGRGARCLVDQRVEPGAPRDWFADAGIQEAMVRHLERLGQALGNHPALVAWEVVGGLTDPVRPGDPDAARALAGALASALRHTGDPVRWTVSSRECLGERGLHPADVVPIADEIRVDAGDAGTLLRSVLRRTPGGVGAIAEPGLFAFVSLVASQLADRPVAPVGVTLAAMPPAVAAPSPSTDGGEDDRVEANDGAAAAGWAKAAWGALSVLAPPANSPGAGPLLDASARCASLPYFRANPRRRRLGLLGDDGEVKEWARVAVTALAIDSELSRPSGLRAADGGRDGGAPFPPLPGLEGLGTATAFYAADGAALDLARPWLEAFRDWWDAVSRSAAE